MGVCACLSVSLSSYPLGDTSNDNGGIERIQIATIATTDATAGPSAIATATTTAANPIMMMMLWLTQLR